MSTLDATVSMLEAMPEEARVLVFRYTQGLFTARKPANPFVPVTESQVLEDLNISRRQIAEGKVTDAETALKEMGARHGFI